MPRTDGFIQQLSPDQPSAQQMLMLERIAGIIGGQLSIDQVGYEKDPSWVKFHFPAVVDASVMMTLKSNSHKLFEGQDIRQWQILKSTNHAEGWGMWLHHLESVRTQSDCKCGVWYY